MMRRTFLSTLVGGLTFPGVASAADRDGQQLAAVTESEESYYKNTDSPTLGRVVGSIDVDETTRISATATGLYSELNGRRVYLFLEAEEEQLAVVLDERDAEHLDGALAWATYEAIHGDRVRNRATGPAIDEELYWDYEAPTPGWVAGTIDAPTTAAPTIVDATGVELEGQGPHVLIRIRSPEGEEAMVTLERAGAEGLQGALGSAMHQARVEDPSLSTRCAAGVVRDS